MESARLPATAATPFSTSARWTLRLPGGRRLLLPERPLLMGILNLTPDSFSDGGLWTDPGRAVDHALAMLASGADLVDLGAESTRPGGGVYGAGARTVPAAEELQRLLPVLTPLRRATAAPLSVDTRKGEVARQALAAGADLINDVSALGDPALGATVAAAGCPLVLMHSRGEMGTMQRGIAFRDLLGEVRGELELAIRRAVAAGVAAEQLIVDPGLGFGKTAEQNLTLLRRLPLLAAIGRPLLVGASRKSFLAAFSDRDGEGGGEPVAGVHPRLAASLAALAWAAAGGAAIVRVHDVPESARFLAAWRALAEANATGETTGADHAADAATAAEVHP
jgi:dihydropteroate synthase